jgi:hypothetical protein
MPIDHGSLRVMISRFFARWISVVLMVCCPVLLWGATAGPDSSGLILIDSAEDDGPPHAQIEMGAGDVVAEGPVVLPFAFQMGEDSHDEALLALDGSLIFSGEVTPCVGAGSWSGFLTGSEAATIRHRVVGRFPRRGLVWDWDGAQLILLEDRDEGVIHLGDSHDGVGIGAQAGAGTGVSWTCGDGAVLSDRSAWVSQADSRSVAHQRSTSALGQAWWGSDAAAFFGEALATGACNEDGLTEVLVGQPERDQAHLFFGALRDGIEESEGASLVLRGSSDSRFGDVVDLADVDGDGRDDVIVSAPGSGDGAVFVFLAASGLSGERSEADADAVIRPAVGIGPMGSSLALGDYDGDGAIDLAVGGEGVHVGAPFGGAVMVVFGPGLGEGEHTASVSDLRLGAESGGLLGTSLVAIDIDGDGVDELAVGSPGAAGDVSAAGQVSVFSLDEGLADTDPILVITGAAEGDAFGSALAAGPMDDSGEAGLVVGAVGVADFGARTGAAYVFLALEPGWLDTIDADLRIGGVGGASATGAAVALGQLDDDLPLELIIGATGGDPALGSGGLVGVFRELPDGDVGLAEADHRLTGEHAGAELGAALSVASDTQGDGYPDLLVAAPLDSPGARVGAGAVWIWPFIPAYLDLDGDGFVAAVSGGLDCADGEVGVNPNTEEVPDNLVDDDCDGWVDDQFISRRSEAGWRYDLDDVLHVAGGTLFDFEDAVEGAAADEIYAAEGMTLIASGAVRVKPNIWGADPVGSLGARVTAGSEANDLIFDFGTQVDAIGLRILDAEVPLRMDALFEGELVVDGYFFEADGPDTPGGVARSFTFASPIDTFRIAASSPNGWGVDDIEVVFAAGSDRDGDGYTVESGDCNDFDPDIGPDAEERFGDGIDNDCDGIIDGGAAGVYYTEGAFVSAISMIGDRIDFETPVLGAVITDQYQLRGINFSGGLTVVDGVGATPPRDTQAGSIDTDTLYMNFIENQPAIALWLLDVEGEVTLEARRDGVLMYSETLAAGYEGFVGLGFPVPVDAFVLRNSISGEVWGVDDVTFSSLGLDDADGDGFTERDGDCDDDHAEAYPGGTEVWYDGIDGDCDGGDDYDADGDGHASTSAGGLDCDDAVDTTHPGAEDAWYDGVDADCRGDDDFDADGDGHAAGAYGGSDCDDDSDTIHPDADEVFYDDTDDDCDPTTDYDADGDGYASSGFPGAIGAIGVGDCDDASDSTHPDAPETWYDGIDADCGGDDDYDADGDGHIPIEYGGDDCDDGDGSAAPGAPEDACYDGIDADCDGFSDFDCDRDGHDAVAFGGDDCDDADPAVFPGDGTTPEGPDADCDGYVDVAAGGTDCDDTDAATHPDAEEVWYDGHDSDCDGGDDYDRDGDGHRPGAWADEGTVADCDDSDAGVFPGAIDACGGGDEDCDGVIDEDCAPEVDTGDPIEPADDGGGAATEDTGHGGREDTGDSGAHSLDTGAGDAPDTGADVAADSGSGGAARPSSSGGGPGKTGNCGCHSANRVASWFWAVPLFVAMRRRRRHFRGYKK